jgi:hypothetical protein
MIDKLEFYHGAAIIRLIEDPRCQTIIKHGGSYKVNRNRIVLIKYSTKARSPWRFTVSREDVARLKQASNQFSICVMALVCGGDGVCALSSNAVNDVLGGKAGWLSAKRDFGGRYAVSGPEARLKTRIAMNRWPAIVFDLLESNR